MDHVIVGRIVKVRGIRGEVIVRSLSDVPERFARLGAVLVVEADGSAVRFEIESVRPLQGEYIVKLGGIEDRRAAKDRLVGRGLAVIGEAVPPPSGDENYHFELIGLEVVRSDGGRIGTLESIIETGANDVYVVRGPGGEVLIPATREVIEKVDVAHGRMIVRPWPGLFDDAAASAEAASAASAAAEEPGGERPEGR